MVATSRRRIGSYVVEERLGVGAFATVHRAHDPRFDTTVALKVLADNRAHDPEIRARFIQEGQALRRIDSAHVIAAWDLGVTDEGQPWLALEFADAGTVGDRVDALRRVGWRARPADVRVLVAALADGLAAIHAAGWVHRDLSPGNLLLRSIGSGDGSSVSGEAVPTPDRTAGVADGVRIKIADFGLAKDLARASGMTVGGGTRGFAPPEQATAVSRVDPRADLWSATALVAWLLDVEVGPDGLPADAVVPGGPALAAALRCGLATDPADRPDDAGSWADLVRAALPATTTPTAVPAPTSSPDTPGAPNDGPDPMATSAGRKEQPALAGGPWSRSRLALAGVVVAILVAVGLVVTSGDDGGQVVTLPDGQVEVSRTVDLVAVAMRGPTAVPVGEVTRLSVTVTGTDDWRWELPDGTIHRSVDAIEVTPRSAGTIAVVVVAVPPDGGDEVRVVHDLVATAG